VLLLLLELGCSLLLRSWLEHVAIEVDLDSWVLALQVVEHRLHVTHDALNVQELTVTSLLLLHTWCSLHKVLWNALG